MMPSSGGKNGCASMTAATRLVFRPTENPFCSGTWGPYGRWTHKAIQTAGRKGVLGANRRRLVEVAIRTAVFFSDPLEIVSFWPGFDVLKDGRFIEAPIDIRETALWAIDLTYKEK
jgi:hypothetical protein